MLRKLSMVAIGLVGLLMPARASAQFTESLAGPRHALPIGAAAEYVLKVYQGQFPGVVLVVSPNALPPGGGSLPRIGPNGDTFGPAHPSALLTGVARKKAILVAPQQQAIRCSSRADSTCPGRPLYLSAAFAAPVITGDSATVEAILFTTTDPQISGVDKPASVRVITTVTEARFHLYRDGKQWYVGRQAILARR